MPQNPFPVDILVYDTDGSTPLVSSFTTLQNLRTKDRASSLTQGDGSCSFDLSNIDDFPNGYETGDILFVCTLKAISTIAEKFSSTTGTVSGNGLNLTLTTRLYIDKSTYPLSLIDKRDIERRIFDPTSTAHRVLLVDEDGIPKELTKIGNDLTYVKADIVNNKIDFFVNGQKVGGFA